MRPIVETVAERDPLQWAKRPQSQQAFDAVVAAARTDPRIKEILEKHIADGVCDENWKLLYVWSFAARAFVQPAWYHRINSERAA